VLKRSKAQIHTNDLSGTALFVLLVWMLPFCYFCSRGTTELGWPGKYGWALFMEIRGCAGVSSDDQAYEQGDTTTFVTLPRKATGRVQPSCQNLDKQEEYCDPGNTSEHRL
jgi:hypothetical protein